MRNRLPHVLGRRCHRVGMVGLQGRQVNERCAVGVTSSPIVDENTDNAHRGSLSENSFHEKAGRSQVDSFVLGGLTPDSSATRKRRSLSRWRKIRISLIIPVTGNLSANAWLRQLAWRV
jgi:hypothetical protein